MIDTSHKIFTIKGKSINNFVVNGKNLVVCYGHFNVIHPGHMRYLKYARSLGDSLIIALLPDSEFQGSGAKNYYPENDRAELATWPTPPRSASIADRQANLRRPVQAAILRRHAAPSNIRKLRRSQSERHHHLGAWVPSHKDEVA